MPAQVYQAAAIPVREGLVCLITSRNRRNRWVFPKGRIEPRQSAAEAALVEAWEEAGLVGVIASETIGSYVYEKLDATHHVTAFMMDVAEEKAVWPECGERVRQWVDVEEALRRIEEPGLKAILRSLFPQREAVRGNRVGERPA